ncbi:hypothetical protein [Dietzia alimentaria]|uniref:hypothetical protein n=1 Tax=Dietzia alimentaria TaxID=665550 RepID=UPI00029A65AA|nr:hypothetical protein [Dietzia alimentaria]
MGVNLSGTTPTSPGVPGGILQQIFDGIGGIGQALADGLTGIIGMIADALFGPGPGDPIVRIADGMTALNSRVELLDDVPGYAGGIMTQNRRFGSGATYKTIPFNSRYGPSKKAQLNTSNHRMVIETGSWSAHFTISTSGGGGVGHGLRALVRDKNGTEVMTRFFDWQTPNAGWDQHYAMPIIVPPESAPWSIELGYRHNGLWWTLYGGTEKTLIWVERKNIDTANSGIIRNPGDGPDVT